ncbi:thiamine phosphate synthase [Haematobacter massiliensis]|uniref:Thiamine-phosphate synthase n=1 Tax=Haematobacter massiliensis TaxID=195105 RepID=A0A086Y505_9RHOB|nr:thiamine phosphate synthase [Haematobacter massiliensis]KFI29355.1 thiamine-phosphate pyrophosphorylase [Haematobacter massiliensis]OWJ71165.1 thiamine phosphate synthase [Haematobacter massiliensis]OWJ84297.1 thiamine phosphate synthase [Haematobacter massiliensis]QBJ25972.1 thiamine phosphate synthase [Haematobacter massiliensis]
MKLDRFYPIFDHPDWLRLALPLGVQLVQLRVKDRTEAETRAMIVEAQALCRAAGAVLVVNDHWQLAIDAGCDWLHLGQEDLDTADLAAIRRAGLRLGLSTHDEAELDRALSHAPDYVALGPVWPTILKKMKWHEQGLDRVREWKARIGQIPLVAIGGLSVDRAPLALDAGADVVSVVTDITLNPEPEARIRAWMEATR